MKVCKFGGSSVADADQIRKVRDILLSDDERRFVVVSAPGKRNKDDEKITDLLYKSADLAIENKSIDPAFGKIRERFISIAEGLGLEGAKIKAELDKIERNIIKSKERAYAASRGEYLSALIISSYLGWEFLDPEGVIVIGDDNKIEDITYTILSSRLKRDKRYVIPGFYGTSLSGKVTTFSRGGSDITGAIVAKAVRADLYENWTDVSGVYSSDPRKVTNARLIEELSYREVRDFSVVGASVFHEEAIAPCVEESIPINIKNTNSPSDKGTIIKKSVDRKGVVGVSGKGGLVLLSVHKLLLSKDEGRQEEMKHFLKSRSIKPLFTVYGSDSVSWYFEKDKKEGQDEKALSAHLKAEFKLDEVVVESNVAVLGLVGTALDETMEYVDAISVLREGGIKVHSISFAGSRGTFLIGVDENKIVDALNMISQKIFS